MRALRRKLKQELWIRLYRVALSIVYGPGQSYRGVSSFKEIVEKPVMGMPAKVEYGGDQKYDGVYVKDVASSIVAACIRNRAEHRAFNIGTGVLHSLNELADIVSELIPHAKIKIGPGSDAREPLKGPLDISRAKTELDYAPKFNLQAGVEDYVRTMKNQLSAR